VLDPDVVLRSDGGARRRAGSHVRRGAKAVAHSALAGAVPSATLRPALVNGTAGAVVMIKEKPFAVMAFTVARAKIVEIDVVFDPDRLARLDLAVLDG
jgi:RNA polymerase sigma-70 factor (ECF subfamily)